MYRHLACVLLLVISSVATAETRDVRLIALTGQSTVTDPALTYSVLNPEGLDNFGNVFYRAVLQGPGVNNQNAESRWLQPLHGPPLLIVREGQDAPGTEAGTVFDFIGGMAYSRSGLLGFNARLRGPNITPENDEGIWFRGHDGLLQLMVRESMPIPNSANQYVGSILSVLMNDQGAMAIPGMVRGPIGTNAALLKLPADGNQTVEVVMQVDHPAPGLNLDQTIDRIGGFVINRQGRIAVLAEIQGTAVDPSFRGSLWLENDQGDLELVARAGQEAVGMESGYLHRFFSTPSLNNYGSLYFQSATQPIDFSSARTGVWSASGADSIVLKFKPGDLAPDTGGDTFESFDLVRASGTDSAAFVARTETVRWRIWQTDQNSVRMISLDGERAPGTSDDVTFRNFPPPSLTINRSGQILFGTYLEGPSINTSNNWGVWATDQMGMPKIIFQAGDSIEVAPGDVRTIEGVSASLSDMQGGIPATFNDLGQFAFSARFSDGTFGVFVSSVVAIPESSTILSAGLSIALLSLFGRTRP